MSHSGPTVPVAPVDHRRLIADLDGPNVDAALTAALGALASGGSVDLLLAVLRTLVRNGLAGIALRLLRSAGNLVETNPEIAGLCEQLAALPPGDVPLTTFAERYEANRAALAGTGMTWCDALAPAGVPGSAIRVYMTPEGNCQVIRDDDAGRLDLVFHFDDHRRRAAAFPLGDVEDRGSALLAGVPLPPLLERLLGRRSREGFRPPVDIVETDLEVLAVWLHLVDIAPAVTERRVGVFGGLKALDHYAEWLARHLGHSDPTLVASCRRPGWDPPTVDDAYLTRVRAGVEERRRGLGVAQARHQEAITPEQRIARFRAGRAAAPPLRIAGFTTRYSTVVQHAMRDLADAFRRQGCTFDLVKEPDDSSAIVDTWTTLAEPCDLVVVINHLRREMPDRIHADLPFVCWIQDHLPALWSKDAGRSITDRDLVLGYDRPVLTTLFDYPAERFLATSNLTSLSTYHDEPVDPVEAERHRCDVSFVSHGSETVDELVAACGVGQPAVYGRLLAAITERLRERLAARRRISFRDTLDVMLDAEASIGARTTAEQRNVLIRPTVIRIVDRLLRHETLEWTAQWCRARDRTLRIYGRGWERHPTLSEHAAGEIANGEPLRCVSRASRINLQINGFGSLHQRLLDGIASGGFVLVRHNPADFVRPPLLALQRAIASAGVTSLGDLLRAAEPTNDLGIALAALRRLDYPAIAPGGDPRRDQDIRLLHEAAGVPMDRLGDAALFDALADVRHVPHRCAADLPAFERVVFDGPETLHALLDRYVDDEPARRALLAPMRADVAAHDTYDALARRILDTLGSGLVSGDPPS
ncbi:MAG: hypothetical protein GY715_18560 [Planctomycetes bacterium]|nr:hypothetical protein [Planctomycetota bacterium]